MVTAMMGIMVCPPNSRTSENRGFAIQGLMVLFELMKRLLLFCGIVSFNLFAGTQDPVGDLFSYDRSAPLGVVINATEVRADAEVVDLEFFSQEERVKAFLVRPSRPKGPCAAILYVHWLGEPEKSNRSQFLDEALELAGRNVISLLVEAPWSRPNWYQERIPEEDYANSVRQVIAQRRAMDLLLTQGGVDSSRVAIVAHDFGAMYAMLAEAFDKRARTYVFMAPTPHFADWFLFARQPEKPEAYKAQISSIDPVLFIGRLSPAPILFQFASKDFYVSAEEAAEFTDAVKGPKEVRSYDTEHHLRVPQARADRIAWLVRELNLSRPAQ